MSGVDARGADTRRFSRLSGIAPLNPIFANGDIVGGKTRLAGQKRNTTEAPTSVCTNPSLLTLTTQPPEQKIAVSVLTAV